MYDLKHGKAKPALVNRGTSSALTVGIIGALLPPATEKFDHFFGLADYAVSVAGGQILNNMMAAGR